MTNEIRNPKSEIRNPKEIRGSKSESGAHKRPGAGVRFSVFGFRASFGFRISDFGIVFHLGSHFSQFLANSSTLALLTGTSGLTSFTAGGSFFKWTLLTRCSTER